MKKKYCTYIKLVHVLFYDIFVRYFGMVQITIICHENYWSKTVFFSQFEKVNKIFIPIMHQNIVQKDMNKYYSKTVTYIISREDVIQM